MRKNTSASLPTAQSPFTEGGRVGSGSEGQSRLVAKKPGAGAKRRGTGSCGAKAGRFIPAKQTWLEKNQNQNQQDIY